MSLGFICPTDVFPVGFSIRQCPVLDLPSYDLLDEKSYAEEREERIQCVSALLDDISLSWGTWSDEDRIGSLRAILVACLILSCTSYSSTQAK